MTSNPQDSSLLLLGLSGTGKTNFLVALDVILDDQSDNSGLVHSDHAPDRAYIQPLRERWHRGLELDHTSRQAPPAPHHLLVHHPASDTRATFYVPDLAGETFDAQFATRSFPHDFGIKIRHAKGLILFLHCDHESDHALHELELFMDPPDPTTADTESTPGTSGSNWTPEHASRQVKLVDLLQFTAELRNTPLRVAVVISAWDRVENADPRIAAEMPNHPSLFLAKRWPLLDQFLECSCNMFPSRVFGVSARGGGHTDADVARLTSFVRPKDRIILVDGDHRSNDITRPVRWVMGLLDANQEPNG